MGTSYENAKIKNVYAASAIGNATAKSGGLVSVGDGPKTNITNGYYDATVSGITSPLSGTGTPLSTLDMIGDNSTLSTAFGKGGVWKYRTGAYPILTWIENHPIAIMYTATRGAFTSVDGKTTNTAMFNGDISGTIKVPEELQKNSYSYKSSNESVLKVTKGGTIIPVGTGNATITITYTEPDETIGGSASNTYDFTVKQKVNALASVSVSGTTNPGQKLTATASGASTYTYQWYKRKSGSTQRVDVLGATSSTYTLQPSDIGYEFNVDVGASGYATMSSGYTKAVTSVKPSGIDTSNIKDSSVDAMAKGIDGAEYEYAYATSETGNKIITHRSKDKVTISGLSRNKDYWLFTRVAGDENGSYEPSEWSDPVQIKTAKTDVVGPIKLNTNINADSQLIANIADTNLQTGDWKLERVKDGFTTPLTPTPAGDYGLTYMLTDADAGSVIRVSFTARPDSDFQGTVSVETKTILKKSQQAPDIAPTEVENEKKDHALVVKSTAVEADTSYEFGYRKDAKEEIKTLEGTYAADTKVTIPDLDRNTTYYVYMRKAGKDRYEPSAWSPSVQLTTERSSVAADTVSVTGTPKVNETITFKVKNETENTQDERGIWVLERIGDGMNNTLIPTTTSDDTKTITYRLVPEDAGYQIKATFIGTGDYKDQRSTSSVTIQNDAQDIGITKPKLVRQEEYSITARVEGASDDIYEFGYKEEDKEEITAFAVTAGWGKDVSITPLTRDTAYTIYVRKAAKTGYDASGWSEGISARTQKSKLAGNISYEGTTKVTDTLEVTYEAGTYAYPGNDTEGSWQWYLDDVPVPEEKGGTSPALSIEPVDGNPKVKVTYTAKDGSGFEGTVTRDFGTVYKEAYEVPAAPTLTAQAEDAKKEGSVLHLTSTDVGNNVFYYLRLSSNDTLPKRIPVKDVPDGGALKEDTDNVERWLKASDDMSVRVPANRTYVVYAARLESDTNLASEINSTRGKLSAKEPLLREPEEVGRITETDSTVKWKTLQKKTLQYSLYGKAPSATWKYYVTKDPGDDTTWQNINAELNALGKVEEKKDGVFYTTFEIPLKYTGYHFKAVLIGTDDYSSQVELVTPALEGKLLKGTADISSSDSYSLLDELTATYTGDDDQSGTFYWYRRKEDGTIEQIKKDAPGVTSSYQTQQADYQCNIYAVYVAAPSGQFSGEVSTDMRYIKQKAAQNRPEAPELLQVNGNSIQFKAPSNYNTSGMDKIPQVVVGYQKVYEDGTAIDEQITWQQPDDYDENWFTKLDRRSSYKLYAKFLGTDVYAPSQVSAGSEIIHTENELFDEGSLQLQALSALDGGTTSDIGNKVRMSYTGDGFDEGYFRIRRSNGDTIMEQVSEVRISETSVSYEYTYTAEDVGTYIIVDYIAKENSKRFEGTISASNKLVITKPENPEKAIQPKLERDLDTNLYVEVKDDYEYYLSELSIAPSSSSGDWDVLSKDEDGKHQFTNLDRTTTYYLHARIAETKEYRAGTAVTSAGESPTPYIDLKTTEVLNTEDADAAMELSEAIPFPTTLKKGDITIEELSFVNELTPEEPLRLHATAVFSSEQGKATDIVYEKGSSWANKNFATELILYDADGKIVDRTNGTKTKLDAAKAETMRLAVYRANALSAPGAYVWQALLKDSSKEAITALLKGSVTMTTQLKVVSPQQIRIDVDGSFLRQSTNNASLKNETTMPITFGVDRLVNKGDEGLPSLMGVMKGGIAMIEPQEAYLKMSNDGSNFTSPHNGAWFLTETESQKEDLFLLGRGSRADYYVSGAASSAQSWPWDADEEVKDAYGIRFIASVSEEDVGTYEKKTYEIREE